MHDKASVWMEVLDHRELMEVLHAVDYVEKFNHGTSGHLLLTTLAKVAEICDFLAAGYEGEHEKVLAIAKDAVDNMLTAPKPT